MLHLNILAMGSLRLRSHDTTLYYEKDLVIASIKLGGEMGAHTRNDSKMATTRPTLITMQLWIATNSWSLDKSKWHAKTMKQKPSNVSIITIKNIPMMIYFQVRGSDLLLCKMANSSHKQEMVAISMLLIQLFNHVVCSSRCWHMCSKWTIIM